MDSELVIGLVLGFAGLIVTLVGMLWYVSDRIGDKIRETEKGLSGRFDILIERLITLTSDISIIKQLIRAPQTVDIHLRKSNLRGYLDTRLEKFTPKTAEYFLMLEKAIPQKLIDLAVSKFGDPRFVVNFTVGNAIEFEIKTRDLDENAKIIKSFLDLLDEEVSKDKTREWADSIEKKLEEIL